METLNDIRNKFVELRSARQAAKNGTIEIVGASFIADEPMLFGAPNPDYIRREINWYLSESLSVEAIEGGPPKIWKQVASKHGIINSNYGYLFYSKANGSQYENVIKHLKEDPNTRRAVAVYTRPTIHESWNTDGMQDFICTNTVQYLIRNHRLEVVVQMRSNDAIFGYRNDYAWQLFNQQLICRELKSTGYTIFPGSITWQVGSLHIYERHFYLVDHYKETGEYSSSLKS